MHFKAVPDSFNMKSWYSSPEQFFFPVISLLYDFKLRAALGLPSDI